CSGTTGMLNAGSHLRKGPDSTYTLRSGCSISGLTGALLSTVIVNLMTKKSIILMEII
ncbi:Hypothetical protein FKW44_013561, partial [Caligus rogercresseyi]